MAAPQKKLGTLMLAALAIQTVGSVDEDHKLPTPKTYSAVLVLFFVLGLVAQLGAGAARAAQGLAGLVVLMTLLGKGAVFATDVLGFTEKTFGVTTAPAIGATGGPSGIGGSAGGSSSSSREPAPPAGSGANPAGSDPESTGGPIGTPGNPGGGGGRVAAPLRPRG